MAAAPASEAVPRAAATPRRRAGRAALGLIWACWTACALLALGFLAQPLSTSAQLALCGTAGAGMLVLWLLFPHRGLPRMAFLALGSLVVIRYVYWRFTGTLPSLDDPVGFALGLVLAMAELYCVLILTVSLIVSADPLTRAAAPALPEADLPTVDVFIPSYNESAEILSLTVAAARNLDYPADRVTVWLLDDGGTDQKCADPDPARAAAARARRAELQALCAQLGARYLTRARNEHAKAGNLNNGLKASRAEIVLVLDADHAPFRPFLRETVGLFSTDPKLFLVQTPHVFLNPDPVERNLRTFARMPSENEMFYGVTQAGLDKWNGSFFCGSAALLRRAALDEVGGFSGITITEDCETAFELHARGWSSAYIDQPLIAGLQPGTFADFIGQRTRWCQGMFQIMLLKNPLLKRGLRPIQRLCYLSSMTFWFFPLPRLMFMLAPLLHIFFDVKIFVSSIDEALAFTATYIVANMMMQNYLYGRVRWPWISELYEYVQGVYLAKAIASVLVSPRKPKFNVTDKGVSLDRDHLSPLAWPYFAIFGALAAGCATAAWRYLFEPGVTGLMLIVGLWCLFNLVIAGAALGVVAERRQTERCPSLPVRRDGVASVGGESFAVVVERSAADGCSLRRADGSAWPVSVAAGSAGALSIPGGTFAPLAFRMRADAAGDTRDVAFELPHPAAYRGLAELMYGDAAPLRAFLDGRRRHKDLLSGSLRLLAWGITEPVRALAYVARGLHRSGAETVIEAAPAATIARAAAAPSALVAVSTGRAPALAAPAGRVAANVPAPAADEPVARTIAPAVLPGLRDAMPRPARSEAPEDPTRLPLTRAAWADAVAALAAAEQAADRDRLDPATWLAGIMALAGSEHAEPARLDLVRGPDFRAFARGAAESGLDRSAA
ncbi:UDP-forming cellulose synthase catalytic subunit [Methylobacterium sp. NEAU 140]|uniref:UDP-forming cellulose synthase catalytic subunit n=1 Tax=Methylobacterium sp. NEAU 140 TaxID=3064945 RepID=UPI0027344B8C|nr:UDP-forming cellulose synthase catalytic subunit [Methylobacterium sp. NEAU 140]MDP4023016.1 UDP-forming cellulose synthase catalytic subunit [Methylobacterium sp. NEAU 140]